MTLLTSLRRLLAVTTLGLGLVHGAHAADASAPDLLIRQLSLAVRRNVAFVSPLNLNAAVKLLKDLNRPRDAAEMLKHYMAER